MKFIRIAFLLASTTAFSADSALARYTGLWTMDANDSGADCFNYRKDSTYPSGVVPMLNIVVEGDSTSASFWVGPNIVGVGTQSFTIDTEIPSASWFIDGSGHLHYTGHWFDDKTVANCVFERLDQTPASDTPYNDCQNVPFWFKNRCGP